MNPQPTYIDPYIAIYGDLHTIGGQVECIYPPETHGVQPRGWRSITFEVCEELYPPPAMKRESEWTMTYRVVSERALDADEIVDAAILMHPAPRIAIVGSREFPYPTAVRCFVNHLPASAVVVSGGARGVDKLAETAARERGLQVDIFPVTDAEWKRSKRAGFDRNARMIPTADVVIAFWDGKSNGTRDSIKLAERHNKPCRVYLPADALALVNESEAA